MPSSTSKCIAIHKSFRPCYSLHVQWPRPCTIQSKLQIYRRLTLSASIWERFDALAARHQNLLDGMQTSGQKSPEIGKELSSLAAIASLQKEKLAIDDETISIEGLKDEAIQSNDNELMDECTKELDQLLKKRTKLERRIVDAVLPKDDDDYESDAIIEVRAGTGGDEAALFASEILQCYIKTAKELSWKVEELAISSTDLGGIRDASVAITGPASYGESAINDNDIDDDNNSKPFLGPYGVFKFESGVHRVQRIPINDTKIQTSACSVAVLPLRNDNNKNDELLPMAELRIETMRASGAGGQHINTTDSAVRVTHIPTGITASIQDGRSQHENKKKALQLISARVRDKIQEENSKKLGEVRSALMGGGDRSERIRTYNFPQDRITDHRCKETRHGISKSLTEVTSDGNIVLSLLPYLKSIYRQELLEKLSTDEDNRKSSTVVGGKNSKK